MNHTAAGVPKIIHKIWVGNKPLPDIYRIWADEAIALSPGWELKWWFDDELKQEISSNRRQFLYANSVAMRSDLARYDLLHRYGGLYLDTDIQVIQDLNKLLDKPSINAAVGRESQQFIGNAVILSAPYHSLMHDAVNDVTGSIWKSRHETDLLWRVVNGTGPGFFTKIVNADPDVTVFKQNVFYPGFEDSDQYKSGPVGRLLLGPETFTIHHWHNAWLPEQIVTLPDFKIETKP